MHRTPDNAFALHDSDRQHSMVYLDAARREKSEITGELLGEAAYALKIGGVTIGPDGEAGTKSKTNDEGSEICNPQQLIRHDESANRINDTRAFGEA